MVEKLSKGDRLYIGLCYAITLLIGLLCLYPMLHVLFSSFSDPEQLVRHKGVMLGPCGFTLKGYELVLKNKNIPIGYMNTLINMGLGTLLNMALTIVGAYALSRKGYMFKKAISMFIVFTMYFSGGIIPNFLLVQALGLYDTRWALILPGAVATWNLIVMKTCFQSVPASLEEAARIDGANDLVILLRVILPVSSSTIAVIALFYAVAHWNSWFNAMLYLQKRTLYPLQLFLREILITNAPTGTIEDPDSEILYIEEVIRNATIIVSTVPILFAYPFAQRYFISGVMLGSLKE
ncbi:MAG: carbohydrate ABC transporter permease [Aristaeellaceae bacterium]